MSRQVRRPIAKPLTSYRPSGNLPSPTKNRGWKKAKRATIIILGIALFSAIWLGGQIKHIQIIGSTNNSAVEAAIRTSLKQQPLLTRHLLFLDGSRLVDTTLAEHSDVIAKLKIQKNWLSQGLIAEVEDSQAVLVWQSGGKSVGVNQKGIATATASSDLPLVIDSSNLEVSEGQVLVSANFVEFARVAAGQLKPMLNLELKQLRIVDSTNELYVDTSAGYYLRLDTNRPVADQYQAAAAVLKTGAKPSQYIDLRIAHKAYYK